MVKKIFIQNMRIKNMKNQLQYRLSAEFSQQGGREKFDMLNYSIEYLLEVARAVEMAHIRDKNNQADAAGGNSSTSQPNQTRGGTSRRNQPKQGRGKKEKREKPKTGTQQFKNGLLKDGRCSGCGAQGGHGPTTDGKKRNSKEDRAKECPALKKT